MGAREKDLNPDIYIGLRLPMEMGSNGTFKQTKTTLEQTRYNIINLFNDSLEIAEPRFLCGSTGSNIMIDVS